MIMNKKKIAVFYHDDEDGFTGAWAVWKKLGDKAAYKAVRSGGEGDFDRIHGKEIYFIDYSPVQKEAEKLSEANKIILIDHHISSRETALTLPGSLHRLNNSGASLAWEYFHPKKKMPPIIKTVEDYDLWKFKLPFTRELMAGLSLLKKDFKNWEKFSKDMENKTKRKVLIDQGKSIIKYQESVMEKIMENGEGVLFEGHPAFVVNSSFLSSEIGNKIYKQTGKIGIIWSYKGKKDKNIYVSLRGGGDMNLNDLAKKFGGGGHKAAAGFSFKAELPFPWKIQK
ncbi:hypothetical protein C4572_00520 [Candidatus Parcubacteria bacterium]|nr:MAG: hypothetical protein C4572_00520 [Candidatus Parcubacteria bacterium]